MAGWTLDPAFAALAADFGSLDAVFALQGERITKDPLSEVIRIERAGVRYYVKRYWGAGKGLRRYLGRPRVKAEWQNLKYFAKWGIATAPIVAYGLERKVGAFVRGALIAEVAKMVGGMHRAGVNHRDCYICHFLLHTDKAVTADDFRLSVIDLHRAQVRSAVPLRWRNKDLAALYFSALDIGLTRRDTLRFLRTYFQRPLRDILRDEARLLAWLEHKADKLYARKQRYGDAL